VTLSTERQQPATAHAEPLPIWMAALLAGADRAGGWQWLSGRAVYTNGGCETEVVEPFGVPVERGEALVVTWRPNDTEYTVEVFQQACLAA
jgi:hypothetical protein